MVKIGGRIAANLSPKVAVEQTLPFLQSIIPADNGGRL
jgi:hypothetical protein